MNTRSKTLKTHAPQAFIEDAEHQSGALVDDLLTEIFLRLPVTSILRFKSVSKHWRWLLSHKDFTLRYDNLPKTLGIFSRSAYTYIPLDAENRSTSPFRRLDFCSDPSGIRIMQSCNGLLLCCSDRGYRGTRKYYVFNPTTKQFAIVPSVPGGKKVCKTICFMGLAYHQTECVHYKLVCIRSLEPDGKLHQIQIYSSDTGKWKVSFEAFTMNRSSFPKGVYWNGAIHMFDNFDRNHFYFKFDVEQLQTLPLPAELTRYVSSTNYFGESRGHLHLIVNNYYSSNILNMNVYEMSSDYSGWFVKYQVQLDELLAAFPEMVWRGSYHFKVIDIDIDDVRGEKEEDTFLVLKIARKIIKYNVYDKSFQHIFSLGRDLSFGWCESHHHIATVSSF